MKIEERSGVHVLFPEGDLTIFEAAEFREWLLTLQKESGPLELDVSEVETIDSSGVQLILAGIRSGKMVVSGVRQNIQQKFESIGCATFLKEFSGDA